MKISKYFLVVILLIFIIGCTKPKLEDLITIPDGYYLTVENNPEKNSELKAKWLAEDVAYVVYEPEFRKNARNILTISRYSKQDYSSWLDRYLGNRIVELGNKSLTIECNFSSINEKNIQICQTTGKNYSIHRYTFGLADTIIVRVLCLETNAELSNKHCRDLTQAIIKRAAELKLN
ncbi:hypothetical protein JYT91_00850 [archaeon AH-315-M20]|nr:hypothetical protein [archaeon AH-315-M20]